MMRHAHGVHEDFSGAVRSWLLAEGRAAAPTGLDQAVIAAVTMARQRPTWVARLRLNQRWGATGLAMPMAGRGLRVLAIVVLVALAGALVLSVGKHPHPPAPLAGLARNGALAYDANGQIIIVNADGGQHSVVTNDGATHATPVWSLDGTNLAFWTRTSNGSLELTVTDAEGDDARVVSGAGGFSVPSTVSRDAAWPTAAEWSPDGAHLAFSATIDGTSRIVVATLDGHPPSVLGDGALPALSPVWSPDGQWIAFAGGRFPDAALYVMRADGSDVRRLTSVAGAGDSFMAPRWSPDGSRLVYQAGGRSQSHGIWVVSADGSGESAFERPSDNWTDDLWPSWSPDGRLIAFVGTFDAAATGFNGCIGVAPGCPGGSATTVPQLFVMHADGSGLVGLTHPLIDNAPPVWSPDGTRIVARSADPLAPGLVFVDPTGLAPSTVLATHDAGGGWTSWERLAP